MHVGTGFVNLVKAVFRAVRFARLGFEQSSTSHANAKHGALGPHGCPRYWVAMTRTRQLQVNDNGS